MSQEGDLLAYGLGWPPTWCATAAAAEAWALQVVLENCPFPPQMRTDCMAILTTARSGSAQATHHSRPLARVWRRIAEVLGVDIAMLLVADRLAWVPAHRSLSAVGEVKLSNGSRLSIADWRANRLVDKPCSYLPAVRRRLPTLPVCWALSRMQKTTTKWSR